jgi:hypothetical protein
MGMAADDSKVYVAVSDSKFTRVAPDTPGAQTLTFHPSVTWLLDSTTGGGLHALSLAVTYRMQR